MLFLVALLCVGTMTLVSSAGLSPKETQGRSTTSAGPGITVQYQAQDKDGYYKFGYATVDGQYRVEEGNAQGVVIGSYGYPSPDGRYIRVFYKADKNGFQILNPKSVNSPPDVSLGVPNLNAVAIEGFPHAALLDTEENDDENVKSIDRPAFEEPRSTTESPSSTETPDIATKTSFPGEKDMKPLLHDEPTDLEVEAYRKYPPAVHRIPYTVPYPYGYSAPQHPVLLHYIPEGTGKKMTIFYNQVPMPHPYHYFAGNAPGVFHTPFRV